MSAHESMEHAEHAEHASGENRKIALLIAVIALCLALSETLGKGAQTESISKNVQPSNLWAFFQAKSIRRTVVEATSDQAKLRSADGATIRPRPHCKAGRRLGEDGSALSLRTRPAKARINSPRAQRRPRRNATTRRRNTITTNWRQPHFRSASCWRRQPSSPA